MPLAENYIVMSMFYRVLQVWEFAACISQNVYNLAYSGSSSLYGTLGRKKKNVIFIKTFEATQINNHKMKLYKYIQK